MKKSILFFGYLFLLASCAPTKWSINGDITAYNSDGTVLRQWDNVIIESGEVDKWTGKQTTSNVFKTFGFNFTDPQTLKGIIISNAVPCIIEYPSKVTSNILQQDNSLMEKFKSNEIMSLDSNNRKLLENNFIAEIKSNISTAQNGHDIAAIKEKIEILNAYHRRMEQKGSYYDILDALQLINIQLSKKARNLGVKL